MSQMAVIHNRQQSRPRPTNLQQWLERGHALAWEQSWEEAIDAYQNALRIKSDAIDAWVSLGLAYQHTERLNQAHEAFANAHKIDSNDPTPIERMGEIAAQMGSLSEATRYYMQASDAYLRHRDIHKAIADWEYASQLTPGLIPAHARLAQAYERLGDKDRAIREYLILAFNFDRKSDKERARRALEHVLKLKPKNSLALNGMRAISSGGAVTLPEELMSNQKKSAIVTPVGEDFGFVIDLSDDIGQHLDAMTVENQVLEQALEDLANQIADAGLNNRTGAVLQGMSLHRQGREEEAIDLYRQGIRDNPFDALHTCLGLLLARNGEVQEATPHLEVGAKVPAYQAGILVTLADIYLRNGSAVTALKNLIYSARVIDRAASEQDYTREFYQRFLQLADEIDNERRRVVAERMLEMVRHIDYEHRIIELRQHLQELWRDEGTPGVLDFLMAKGNDVLAEQVYLIDTYIRQGRYLLALDESMYTLEQSPFYLPVHSRVASVLMQQGRKREAFEKYRGVAHAYDVRGESDRAIQILTTAIMDAPLDVQLREALIDLLEKNDQQSASLTHRRFLAQTYQQLGDIDSALDNYRRALRLAEEYDPSARADIHLRMAESYALKMQLTQAQQNYEKAHHLMPNAVEYIRPLIEYHYEQNNRVEATRYLDKLLAVYIRDKEIKPAVEFMRRLATRYPKEPGLHARLAAIYQKLNFRDGTLHHLNLLGEIQLQAGLKKQAAETIKQIIGLKPPQVAKYQKLLQQISASA